MKGITDQLLGIARLLEQGERQIARNEAQSVINLHLATLAICNCLSTSMIGSATKSSRWAATCCTKSESTYGWSSTQRSTIRSSFGERLSAQLFAAALCQTGVAAVPIASDFVLTCDNFRDAKPQLERTCRRGRDILQPLLESGIVPVVTGFIGATLEAASPPSVAIAPIFLAPSSLTSWTPKNSSSGRTWTAFSPPPTESAEAKLLHELSYDEAHALAAGAEVLHPHVLPLG